MQRRNTRHRQALIDLFAHEHLLSQRMIAERLPGVNHSTIFRQLEKLVADGEVYAVALPGRETFYEHAAHTQHAHVVCEKCDRVASVPLPKKMRSPKGWNVSRAELLLHGHCERCR